MGADYEAFATEHVNDMLRLARVLTRSREEAEDLTQEALARAFAKWSRVARAQNKGAYARLLLINVHLSRVRRSQLSAVSLDVVTERPRLEQATTHEDRDALRRAVASLPPRQRTVLVLRYYEDLDLAEIAHAMRLKQSSVRSAQTRALATLHAALATEEEGVPRA